ncbi:MAG TPA: hypothetical protein VKE97_01475 [Acidimicrobiia bacterium]|nr:hypothetical protein [Acidimicrobiia bacterium]
MAAVIWSRIAARSDADDCVHWRANSAPVEMPVGTTEVVGGGAAVVGGGVAVVGEGVVVVGGGAVVVVGRPCQW